MTEAQQFDRVKVTNTRNFTGPKKTTGQAPMTINTQCRTMYTNRPQLPDNKKPTLAREASKPAREAGFLSGAWTDKIAISVETPREKRAERRAKIEAGATSGHQKQKHNARRNRHENKTQSNTHSSSADRGSIDRRRHRQRLPGATLPGTNRMPLDHNAGRHELLQIKRIKETNNVRNNNRRTTSRRNKQKKIRAGLLCGDWPQRRAQRAHGRLRSQPTTRSNRRPQRRTREPPRTIEEEPGLE